MKAQPLKPPGRPLLGDLPGVTDAYVPGPGEINNLVYLTLLYTVDWHMRKGEELLMLAVATRRGEPLVGKEGISRLVFTACEYAWDHLAGEPSGTSPQKLFDHMSNVLTVWYSNTTREEREKIE